MEQNWIFIDGGDGWSYEIWQDPETGKNYRVPIEIIRSFDQAEEV